MSNAMFVDDWNSIIPFKIKAADLEKPTEQFLYKAVLHFFKLMHYDVSSFENMYNEPIETLTMKRVGLVTRINYIYQLCSDSKQTSFFYADLVKPTAKKVIHLLKILLNYLFYINMVKDTVLEKAKNCTEKYFEVNARLNKEQIAKEKNKIRAKNINRHIDDLKNQLPQVERQIEALAHRKKIIYDKFVTLKANHQELADKLVQLKIVHAELAEEKVADEEVGTLQSTIESLEQDIVVLTDTEKQLQTTNAIHITAINEIRNCITLLETLHQLTFDDSCKMVRSSVAELKLQCATVKDKYNELLSMYEALNLDCKEIEISLAERQQEFNVRQKVLDKSEKKNDCKLMAREKYVESLQKTNELLEFILEVQQMEVGRIIKMTEKSLNVIKQTKI